MIRRRAACQDCLALGIGQSHLAAGLNTDGDLVVWCSLHPSARDRSTLERLTCRRCVEGGGRGDCRLVIEVNARGQATGIVRCEVCGAVVMQEHNVGHFHRIDRQRGQA